MTPSSVLAVVLQDGHVRAGILAIAANEAHGQ